MTLRRKDKEIIDRDTHLRILTEARFITIALCRDNEPYLVTMNHGYDAEKHCLYVHCAKEGKKIDILRRNDRVWGQAILDRGYVQGSCDHLYASVHFGGRMILVDDMEEKRRALEIMIRALEDEPEKVLNKQGSEESVAKVQIARIDILEMTGKKAEMVIISL